MLQLIAGAVIVGLVGGGSRGVSVSLVGTILMMSSRNCWRMAWSRCNWVLINACTRFRDVCLM